VRFFTIADFDALCEMNGIAVRERLAFDEMRIDANCSPRSSSGWATRCM
jgi:hypothetical protein